MRIYVLMHSCVCISVCERDTNTYSLFSHTGVNKGFDKYSEMTESSGVVREDNDVANLRKAVVLVRERERERDRERERQRKRERERERARE